MSQRELHKSMPYLRLKNNTMTSKCQKTHDIKLTKKFRNTFKKPKRPNWRAACPLARAPGALKGGTFRIFLHPFSRETSKKIAGGPFEVIRKNWKEGPFRIFQDPFWALFCSHQPPPPPPKFLQVNFFKNVRLA